MDIISWVKDNNKNNYNDIYFYFDLKYNNCGWTNNQPNKSKVLEEIRWKINNFYRKVIICCSKITKKELYNKDNLDEENKNNFSLKHISILKSNLQKSIRRKLYKLAIKTSVSMIKIEDNNNKIKQIGLYELLRRLTIIIIEDTILNKYFNILFWFQIILSKGYYLNKKFIDIVLISVLSISNCIYQDKEYLNYKINEKKKLLI